MKINLTNHIQWDKISKKNGFGYAAENIEKSLRTLGYDIGEELADVQIWWDQPHWIKWQRGVYKIAYFPWESTELLPGWLEKINTADEVWTPSPLIAKWLPAAGVTPPVYVYEHGVDHELWKPVERKVEDKLRFLHLGYESSRKYGPQTMQAFRKAFAGRDDVEITFKMYMPSWGIEKVGKITVMNQKVGINELVELFHDHHVFSFVSGGEGFGLPPLQAMSTGMPVIANGAWAPYLDLMDKDLYISSKMTKSSWVHLHPGDVMRPSFDELVDKMRYVVDNYDDCKYFAMSQVEEIKKRYDWVNITRGVFEALEERLKNS